jgi:hypothetical protein
MEAILWQDVEYQLFEISTFSDLGPTIAALADHDPGWHAFNQSKYGPLRDKVFPAVGATCTAQSALGYAKLDGFTNTWSDFRVSPPTTVWDEIEDEIWEFNHDTMEFGAWEVFSQAANSRPSESTDGDLLGLQWLSSVFTEGIFGTNIHVPQIQGMRGEDLQLSMQRAYGAWASQLMYRGRWSAADRAAQSLTWTSSEMKVAEEVRVLVPGVLSAIPVLLLLGLWSLSCTVLIVTYGFHPRWAETLDAYSTFRFGARSAQSGETQDFETPLDMEACTAVNRLPGMVGDSQPGRGIGQISLASSVLERGRRCN